MSTRVSKRSVTATICLVALAQLVVGDVLAQSSGNAQPQVFAPRSTEDDRNPVVFKRNLQAVTDQVMVLERGLGLPQEALGHVALLRQQIGSASDDAVARVAEQLGPDIARAQQALARIEIVPTRHGPPALPGPESAEAPWAFDPSDVVHAHVPGFSLGENETSGGPLERFCTVDFHRGCATDADCIGVPGCPICDEGPCIDAPHDRHQTGTLSFSVSCNDRPTDDLLRGLLLIATVLEGIRVIADRICEETIVGENVSVACIVVDILAVAGKAVFDFSDMCRINWGDAEAKSSYDRLGALHGVLETAQGSLEEIHSSVSELQSQATENQGELAAHVAEVQTKVTEVQTQLTEHNTAVQNQIAALTAALAEQRTLLLRIDIERALIHKERLAALYLPNTTALKGQLPLVRQIVEETIARVTASGESASTAQPLLTSAITEMNAGRYKRAFTFFSAAYFEAVKILGESQSF